MASGARIEISGGLVREDDRRIVGQRTADGNALLFAAGELRRIVMRAIGEPDFPQQLACAVSRIATAGDLHRQQHVIERRERRDQMKELEYEPDLLAPESGELVFAQSGDVRTVDLD